MDSVYLSIIIPTYNEAERLPDTLALLKDYLETQDYQFEVLIVDDGSTDETVAVVQQYQPRFPGLRLITNQENKGKGGVVRQGMLAAAGAYRLFMDADHSTPVNEICRLLKEVPAYDVVVGSRYLEPGSIKLKQPLRRRILSRAGNLLVRLLLLPGIADTQCGFKLFSAAATEAIFPLQTMQGWSFDIELLTIAKQLGFTIKEVPVDWFDAKRSTLRATRAAARSLRDLWQVHRNLSLGKYQKSL